MTREPYDFDDGSFLGLAADIRRRVTMVPADDIRRRAYRRMRRRMALLSVAALVTAGLAIALPRSGAVGPPVSVAPTARAVWPSPSVLFPTPPPATHTAPTPGGTPTPTAYPTGSAPRLSNAPHDLVLTGPSRLVLKPFGDHYEGIAEFVAFNVGTAPNNGTIVAYELPDNLDQSDLADAGFSGCAPVCGANPISAHGGSAVYRVRVVVPIRPTPGRHTIGPLHMHIGAQGSQGQEFTDATPANNDVTLTVYADGG